MIIEELHYDFKFKVDRLDSLQKADFQDNEIDWLLNDSILNFVDNTYRTFEINQRSIDDIRSLVIKSPEIQSGITPTLVSPNIYEVDLSTLTYKYRYLIRSRCLITDLVNNCGSKTVDVKIIQHDDLTDVLNNPLENPNYLWGQVVAVFSTNNKLYLYSSSDFTIDQVYLDYIKDPAYINKGSYGNNLRGSSTKVECDLPEHTHPRIVNLAVLKASLIAEDPKFTQFKQQALLLNK